jgi:hypothetical protein
MKSRTMRAEIYNMRQNYNAAGARRSLAQMAAAA